MKTYLYLSTAIISVSLAAGEEAWAQCVSTQDCTALGYTESSCPNGKGVKCPFGNKWFCGGDNTTICKQEGFTNACTGAGQLGKGESCANLYKQCDCQSTYKYTCTGAGYSGGSGSACNGKYTACKCSSGYNWNAASGACIPASPICEIGTLYYSDNTCSNSKVSGKTLLGVVIYSNGTSGGGWIMTVKPIATYIDWGVYGTTTGIKDKAVSASCTNTQKLVALGSSYQAAITANNYKPTGTPSGKSWCLPSYDLLNNLNNSVNFAKVNAGITTAGGTKLGYGGQPSYSFENVWSSSEYSRNIAWYFYANTSGSFSMDGDYGKYASNSFYVVRPVMEF